MGRRSLWGPKVFIRSMTKMAIDIFNKFSIDKFENVDLDDRLVKALHEVS